MERQYASVSQIEIVSLTKLKAPSSVWSVVCCLNHYARQGTSCFPSVKTIGNWLNGSLPVRTIYFALKWLVDHDLISRQKSSSRQRFILKLRQKAQQAGQHLQQVAKRVQRVAVEEKHMKKSKLNSKMMHHSRVTSSVRKSARKKGRRLERANGCYGMSQYPEDTRSEAQRTVDAEIDLFLEAKREGKRWRGLSLSSIRVFKDMIIRDMKWGKWLEEHHLELFKVVKPA